MLIFFKNLIANIILSLPSKNFTMSTEKLFISDSLCYEIETEDVYKDMREMVDLLDTSNYVEDHPLFSNKKTPGKFKDELGGKYYVSNIGTTRVYS